MKVKAITNRLLESRAKLDKLARSGTNAITSERPSQAGLYVRPGTISSKTGRLGSHALYCRLKNGRKYRIAQLDEIYTREADAQSRQMSLGDVEAICRRWREQGHPDRSLNVVAEGGDSDAKPPAHSLSWCFEKWFKGDIKGKARKRSPRYLREARRKWDTYTPTEWHNRAILDITGGEIMAHAEAMRDGDFRSLKTGKPIKSRIVAREWLTMMSSVFSATRFYHGSAFNPYLPVLEYFPKGKGGHRCLTDLEIAAVLNFKREDCRPKVRGGGRGPVNVHLWLRMLALKFCLLGGFRRSALADLKVAEINGVAIDRETPDKTFDYPHRLPIPTQMRALLDEALDIKKGIDPDTKIHGDGWQRIIESDYLFCTSDGRRYSNERELLKYPLALVIEWCELPKVKGKKQSEAKHFTAHCCRYTIETHGNHLGVDPDPILNHQKPRKTGDIYDDPTDEMLEEQFERVIADHQRIVDRLFEIAAR